MDFKIAIPSYKREKLIKEKTLAYLQKCNIDFSQVYIFVSNTEEKEKYLSELAVEPFSSCVIVCPETPINTVTEKFNYVHSFFPEGTNVLVMEDDVKELVQIKGKLTKAVPFYELQWPIMAFKYCLKASTKLWGIIPHDNGFYMKYQVSSNLKFCVAHCYGFISDHSKELQVTQIGKSDYERTILYFLKFGSVIRFNYIGVRTTSYTTDGGVEREGRNVHEENSCQYLVKRYPHFIRFNDSKESLYRELSFQRVKNDLTYWQTIQDIHDEKMGFKGEV